VGLTLLGVLAGLVILAGIAWGQGRLGGEQATAPPPAPDTGVMSAVQQQIAQLEAIVAQEPGNADSLFQLGEIYIQGQQWEQAITYFRRLLDVQPNNAHAQTDIGIAHMELGRYIEAEAALFKALESDPNYVHAHYTLGFVYAFGSPADPEAARQHWQEVVNLVPDTELAQVVQVHLDQLGEEPPSR
jgi:tetratricopeptide (TPR) repeat protein